MAELEHLKEECGVFGMYDFSGGDVATSIYYGLFALQHRGQESCGIAVSETNGPKGKVSSHKDMGLLNEAFTPEVLEKLKGDIGVGHVRYSTAGSSTRENAQPLVLNYVKGTLGLAHNGNLINTPQLHKELEYTGAIFQTTIDSEVIAYLIARERLNSKTVEEAVGRAMKKLKGAYSLIVMSPRKLIGARDPFGFRPLCIGKRDNAYVLASETCALDTIGAEFIRDVEPGEIVTISPEKGIESDKSCCILKEQHARCVFEYIYFARPDSLIDGCSVYHSRIMAGKYLAMDSPVEADIVTGVPESGNCAAMGYAMQSGIPYNTAFVKNSYVGRTFIKPKQKNRESSVQIKLNPIREVVDGKRVIMIDDSIVRGTTSDRIVKLLRDAGAKEVHVRISSPPFLWPCYFGTDVPAREQLIAYNRSVEEIRQIIGADSLAYLSLDRLPDIVGGREICTGCFTGKYPMEPPQDDIRGEFDEEKEMSNDRYVSPLSERYASKEMQYIFSPDKKFRTWRRLWVALAETEMELGLSQDGKPVITQEQIDELKEHLDDINYDVAKEREKQVRHDVMSHVYAYGQQCPKAAGIIHLGATSCYVGDNTDIIVMAEALQLVKKKLVNVIDELAKFADKYKELPTLAFTHFQPAQPTTVGKRATLWAQEFVMDLSDLDYVASTLKLLGSKGTTGTQASFQELFNGDQETIDKIDPMIAAKMGFKECYPVSGQTYSRKVDTRVLNVLAGIAASAHKFSNDIRLLQHLKEVEEPFEKSQIGSSAMAYKRNPMRSERMASLADFVIADALNPAIVSSTQWFERTLDDSANKRMSVPEGFLAVDGILDLYLNVVDGLVVYEKVINRRLMSELPFMATENIMMDAVKAGGDRQELHERIRELSMEAGKRVKQEGLENNLLELIAADPMFGVTLDELKAKLDPSKYVGRSKEQVEEYLAEIINPILDANKEELGMTAEINV